ncbi:MAG: hypothetical protein AAGI08_10520 [Bacteroidota bacterium]
MLASLPVAGTYPELERHVLHSLDEQVTALAKPLEAQGSWQRPGLESFIMAWLFTNRLALARPSIEAMPVAKAGDADTQRWRHVVRLRDHLARCKTLEPDLAKPFRRPFRSCWFELEATLRVVETATAASTPVTLSPLERVRIWLQSAVRSATFRR